MRRAGSARGLWGVVCCLVAAGSWGAMFPVMTGTLRRIDPFTFTAVRYSVATACFFAIAGVTSRGARVRLQGQGRGLGAAWGYGTAGFAGFQFLVYLGQSMLGGQGALIASVMMATTPLLGFLVDWALTGVMPRRACLAFIALSFVGVLLVVTRGDGLDLLRRPEDLCADGVIVAGAFCWVVYTRGVRRFPQWTPVIYTTVTAGLGLLSVWAITAALLLVSAVHLPTVGLVIDILPALAYMSLVAAVVGVLCWNTGNRILGPQTGVLFMNAIPLTAFLISTVGGVAPTPVQVLGCAVTGSALVGNTLLARTTGGLAAGGTQEPPVRRSVRSIGRRVPAASTHARGACDGDHDAMSSN